jgi:hypothetical protein
VIERCPESDASGPTLDTLLGDLFAAARSPGPGRYPRCPVCTGIMSADADGPPSALRCGVCGATLADGDPSQLQLVA